MDDEAPAREELRFLLEEIGAELDAGPVQVVGEATNGEEALVLLRSLQYDLVLLDIRMPGLDGLDVARALTGNADRPQVIFTTAYPDHAVEAFDLAAADYVLKPVRADRLRRAVDRALSGRTEERTGEPTETPAPVGAEEPRVEPTRQAADLGRIPVQKDGRTVLLDGDAIVYAAASRGYSALKLAETEVLVSFSLTELERRLPGHFVRVHRAHLVNLRRVRELIPDVRGTLVLVMNDRRRSRVEVSRRHTRELRHRLGV